MSCLNIVEKNFAPKKVEHFNNTAFVDYLYQLSCFLRRKLRRKLGPFMRQKISRSLRKIWTPRIWYKIYIHVLFNPRPAQVSAHPGRWVLGWTYPSRGLRWTWKCPCKCTHWSTGSRHRCHCGARSACKISERILKDSCPLTAPVIAGLINNSFQQSISFLTHGNWRKASQYQKIETRRLYQLIRDQLHYCLSCQR